MNTAHVLPVDDLIEHITATDDCPCGPHVELVAGRANVPDGWLVTHHSLDGRERQEQP